MKRSHIINLALLAASGQAFTACGSHRTDQIDPADTEVSFEPQRGGARPPPAGANGLSPSCFWAGGAQQALRSLGTSALDAGGGVLPAVPLAKVPAACRDVLRDTVECALPLGQTLEDPVTGDTYGGWWGLAAAWATGALGTSGRRYVTACLLQRLNASGTEVPILLEGPHPAIANNPSLDNLYPILESTAFGDLFSSPRPTSGLLPAFDAFVCWEHVLPQSCGFLGLPLLEQRICDDAPLCGFLPIGPCDLVCEDNGPYHECRTGLWSPFWTQTVRVRLEAGTCQ